MGPLDQRVSGVLVDARDSASMAALMTNDPVSAAPKPTLTVMAESETSIF